tara:strand:+ start:691 stop:927 length:237 start_codon:yes stop_codon:yes gene_type:complete
VRVFSHDLAAALHILDGGFGSGQFESVQQNFPNIFSLYWVVGSGHDIFDIDINFDKDMDIGADAGWTWSWTSWLEFEG